MYIPKHFQVHDQQLIKAFIEENAFATIISSADDWPVATHVPLYPVWRADGPNLLWGHVSKANHQWKNFLLNDNVLVIFLSPVHSYISSSWYNHPNAPTWNYMSVQVKGKIKIIEGELLWESVRRLTDKYEASSENPVSLDNLPESVQKQMNGIVGFEISMMETHAAFKLSQNRSDHDFANIVNELEKLNSPQATLMADCMRRHRNGR